MKNTMRIIALLTILLLLAASLGCVNSPSTPENPTGSNSPVETGSSVSDPTDALPTGEPTAAGDTNETAQTEKPDGSRILVIYFSRTGEQYSVGVIDKGNTAIVAEMIAEQTGADICEVLPADDHYPMTYNELTDVAKREQNENSRPAYAGELPNLSQYDTVFIGAPVWWGDWPMIMYTVFENNDFSGKKLIPFSTHEGSGLSGFDRKLASACPNAEVLEGLAIRGNDAQNNRDKVKSAVNDWLTRLGY